LALKLFAEWAGHTLSVNALFTTSDGRIVSGSSDGTMRIWDCSLRLTTKQAKKIWNYLQSLSKQNDGFWKKATHQVWKALQSLSIVDTPFHRR